MGCFSQLEKGHCDVCWCLIDSWTMQCSWSENRVRGCVRFFWTLPAMALPEAKNTSYHDKWRFLFLMFKSNRQVYLFKICCQIFLCFVVCPHFSSWTRKKCKRCSIWFLWYIHLYSDLCWYCSRSGDDLCRICKKCSIFSLNCTRQRCWNLSLCLDTGVIWSVRVLTWRLAPFLILLNHD